MLKLKRVEIQGFKSFYDRTEMKFRGSGIAAIVGPNGCGKSNLSDAISWVLGEQSAKTLRGARMEDVIFAGTREKKPLSMASVTMTLIPHETLFESAVGSSKQESATEVNGSTDHGSSGARSAGAVERKSEITISRRLYRSGESEYLVNGKLARLRDIQDLFLGTGLGPESYAIIEQGRIGQILSNKPQDRRNLIEEAAGITKFKLRKRLAEAKLEGAKQNLSRVFDILEEVTRQVNSLKRQAAKTKRYSELKGEATFFLRQVLVARFRMLEREAAKIAIELNLASAELQKVQTTIATREQDQSSVLEASYVNERELTAARKLISDLHLEAERARGRLEYQLQEIQEIERRLNVAAQEAQALEGQRQGRITELEQQQRELEALEIQLAEAQGELESKRTERQKAENRFSEQQHALENARQGLLHLLNESSVLKNQLTQAEAQLGAADREAARAQSEEQQLQVEISRIQKARTQLSGRLAAQQAELMSASDQRKSIEEELQRRRSELGEAAHSVERMRVEFSRVKARKDSLEEILQHRSYTTETVKRLFTAIEGGEVRDLQPLGVVADFVEVDPQLEKAAEEFLHDELEYVVVRGWDEAERGIETMRTGLSGRATFLVEAARTASDSTRELPQPALEPGMITRLADALRFTNGFSDLPVDALPRIANCYVVSDRAVAQQLAGKYPHCWFLVSDGVSYHGHAVSGGKKTGAGPLGLKRELREVSRLEEKKQQELLNAQASFTAIEREISDLAEQLERLRVQQQGQERDVLAMDHESRKLAEELQRAESRLSQTRLELIRLGQDRAALEAGLAEDRVSLEKLEQVRARQEQDLAVAREQLTKLQGDVACVAEEHATLRANLASLEERQRSLLANRARLTSQIEDFTNRKAQLQRETERLQSQRAEFLKSNTELEAKGTELNFSINRAEASVQELAERESNLRGSLAEIEEELKQLRVQVQTAQEKRSELNVALARAESDLKYLEETCQRELDTSLQKLVGDVDTVPEDAQIEELQEKYTEVRRRIEALGPVNPEALQEFEEAQQRQEFLNTQRQDLLDSIRDLEKAMHEIDTESRKRFVEAFNAINTNFRELFRNLFGGGVAEMRLTDEDNVSESGIDIVASPPGKKLQSVLLLSGGEKSLTAMALLMAIFQYTPSPFCVLDEVDAPLDELNIERLTKLLNEMADQTQFIVITHAKRTMEAAETLYGVTMQEPGISKLVSVKFEQFSNARQPKAQRQLPVVREEAAEHVSSAH